MILKCKTCDKNTAHKLIRNFKIRKWFSCEKCNTIQVITNDNE